MRGLVPGCSAGGEINSAEGRRGEGRVAGRAGAGTRKAALR